MRVETGVVQFGEDWPGVFIRGDNAAMYALALSNLIEGKAEPLDKAYVGGLVLLLQGSIMSSQEFNEYFQKFEQPVLISDKDETGGLHF